MESRRATLPRKSKSIYAKKMSYYEPDEDDEIFLPDDGEKEEGMLNEKEIDSSTEEVVNQKEIVEIIERDNANEPNREEVIVEVSALCLTTLLVTETIEERPEIGPSTPKSAEIFSENISDSLVKTFKSQSSQTTKEDECNKCIEFKTEKTKLLNEVAEEKSKRLQTETTLDVKKRRYELALNQIKQAKTKSLEAALNATKNLKENIAVKDSKEKQLLKTIETQKVKLKEFEELLDTVTRKFDQSVNENKTLKKLYQNK